MPDPASRLAERRREVAAHLARLEADLEALRTLRAATSDDDEHDPDGVPLSEEWSRLEGLRAVALASLDALDAAAASVESGDYGRCVVCGRPIDQRRLEARPSASTCIDCAG